MADLNASDVTSVDGAIAHNAVFAANPLPVGGFASAATPSAVSADGNLTRAWFTTLGALNVRLVDAAGVALTGGVAGSQSVGGAEAADAPVASNPLVMAGRGSVAVPAPMSADGDVTRVWTSLRGSVYVTQAAANGDVVGIGYASDGNTRNAGTNLASLYTDSVLSLFRTTSLFDPVRGIEALSTAPNTNRGIMASGVGPGFDIKNDPAGVVATSTANAVTYVVNGADVVGFHVTAIGVTPGSMVIETTSDDTNWTTAGHVVKLSSGPDLRIEGSFVPAVNDIFLVRVTGHRQVRYRVNAVYASGTATVKITAAQGVGMVKAIDIGSAPHNMGYAIASATAQYTTTQTSTTIGPTVSATQRMVVTAIQIQAGGTTAGELQVYFGTGAYTRGTSKAVFDGEFAPSATSKPGVVITPPVPFTGAADEELKVTTSAAINKLTVTFWYYLISA